MPNASCFSQDPNCERLSSAAKAEIVVSMSAMKEIFDNFAPNFEKCWEIPVIVRVYPDGRRTVFLDKPLPSQKGRLNAV